MNEQYFDWLCDLVKEPDRISQGILRILFDTEFFEVVPNDHNRALDGLALREECRDPFGIYPMGVIPCTVFEMMIALSRHMDDMSSAIGASERASHWFWVMVDNLGLKDYTVLLFDETDVSLARTVVEAMVRRLYLHNGHGGLFPLRKPPQNQLYVEVWYQMQHWLTENL